MDTSCQNCRFFAVAETHQQDSGQCRRYPPTIPTAPSAAEANLVPRTGVWPMVSTASWCGEFEARKGESKS